jgi:hypothetical protein
MKQILTIQSGLRMFKAIKVFKRLRMVNEQQQRAALRFERGFVSIYRTKPSLKRQEKINKILNDEQRLLLQERILVDNSREAGPLSRARKSGLRAEVNVHQGATIDSLLHLLNSTSKGPARQQRASLPQGEVHRQLVHLERREKTLQALKYIQKYKFLYKSAKPADKYRLMQLLNQQSGGATAPSVEQLASLAQAGKPTRGKFVQDHPHKSSYANPEYKAGAFEELYNNAKSYKKAAQGPSKSSEKQSKLDTYAREAQQRQHSQIIMQIESSKAFTQQQLTRKWLPKEHAAGKKAKEKDSLNKIVNEKL